MKILILGTVPNDILNFRADLIKDILEKDHQVIASSSPLDSNSNIHVKKLGILFEPIFLNRHGLSLTGDIRTFVSLLNLLKKQKPHLKLGQM